MPSNHHPLVLVTGANGAIGSALVKALQGRYAAVGLDYKCQGSPIECIEADISNLDSLTAAIAEFRKRHGDQLAAVVHLAAYYDFTGEENPLYRTVNVEGTGHLMAALQGLRVERLVYTGTMLVHKPTVPGLPLNEHSPLEPKWAYPKSKAEAEEAIRQGAGSMPYAILRLAGMYDEMCHAPTLAHQIQRIREGGLESHVFPGNTSHGQSFVHRDDLIDAIVRTIDARDRLPRQLTLLIGEPSVMSYEALQQELGQLIHGDAWATRSLPKPLAKVGAVAQDLLEKLTPDAVDQGRKPFIRPFMVSLADDHFELDITRARQFLGWEPRHALRNELPNMVRNLQRDAAGFYRANKLEVPGSRVPG